MRHCEVLNHPPLSDGPRDRCFFGELVNAASTDRYVLSGSRERNGPFLMPEFTIHGFRFAAISGAPNITAENIEAVQISADVPQTGFLHFPDAEVSQLRSLAV